MKPWIAEPTHAEEADAGDNAKEPVNGALTRSRRTRRGIPMRRSWRRRSELICRSFRSGETDYALGTAAVKQGGTVVVGLPMPYGMRATMTRLRDGGGDVLERVPDAAAGAQSVHAAVADDDQPGAVCVDVAGAASFEAGDKAGGGAGGRDGRRSRQGITRTGWARARPMSWVIWCGASTGWRRIWRGADGPRRVPMCSCRRRTRSWRRGGASSRRCSRRFRTAWRRWIRSGASWWRTAR